ncbi:hypothetical protein SGRIM128S_09730 [Streptomyces griseomycini]
MELELRHLKTIRAIADAGSLTRAATDLGLAQPALSAQLKRIERALGGELFERGRHGVRVTALGELVLERTRIVLPAVTELQQEAARFARTPRATACFRLGGTHGPLLGALVDRLADAAPDARMTTCTSWSERELAGLLAEGRLDFALAGTCGSAPPPGAEGLVWREVAVDPVFVMLPLEDHPLAHRAELDLAELAGEEWACVPGDGCFGDCFTAACARAGFTPRRMYETDTASLVHLATVGETPEPLDPTGRPHPALGQHAMPATVSSTDSTNRFSVSWQRVKAPHRRVPRKTAVRLWTPTSSTRTAYRPWACAHRSSADTRRRSRDASWRDPSSTPNGTGARNASARSGHGRATAEARSRVAPRRTGTRRIVRGSVRADCAHSASASSARVARNSSLTDRAEVSGPASAAISDGSPGPWAGARPAGRAAARTGPFRPCSAWARRPGTRPARRHRPARTADVSRRTATGRANRSC